MRRTRVIAGLAVLALVAGAVVGAAFLIPGRVRNVIDPGANARREHRPQGGPDESKPIGHTHVGQTREQLVAELGEPTREGPWPIGMPRDEVFQMYPGLRTLEWHWPSGQFLASVYPVDGRWECFDSYWVPNGWVLD
jgi:hypothetical protein